MNDSDFATLNEKIWAAGARRDDLVVRVTNALRQQIVDGQLAPGTKFIPEADLARKLGISRPSLREAIRILAHDGMIEVKHGVGTFVSKQRRPMLGSLEAIRSLSDLIREAGGDPADRDVRVELIEAPAFVSEALGIERDTQIGHIFRVRMMSGTPFVCANEYIVLEGTRTYERLARFSGGSLYQFMRDEFGVRLTHSTARISAVAAAAPVAQLLGLKKSAPLLMMHELHFLADGKPVLLAVNQHNTEVVEFTSARSGVVI